MTMQRIIAVVMILGSSVLTAWASGDIAFPAILCMLGLLGVLRWFTWDIRPERHFITPLLLLLLAILFALHCHYAHVRADQAAAFAWQTIARYFLASMILILFLRPQRTGHCGFRISNFGLRSASDANPPSGIIHPPSCASLPPALGLFHLATTMAAGQVVLLDDRYVLFRLSELLSVTLVILYAALDGRPLRIADLGSRMVAATRIRNSSDSWLGSWLPLGLLLLVAINLGWIGGSLLYRHVEVINFLPALLSRGTVALEGTTAEVAHVGFSTSGKLSNVLAIKENTDSTPVLTITGSNPTYLRAMAFETYHQSAWHELSSWEAIAPEQNLPFGMLLVGRTSLFRVRDAEASREMTIRHEASLGDAMFTPLGTCFVEAPFGVVMHNEDGIIKSPSVRNRQSYRVGFAASTHTRPPTGLQLHHLAEPPRQLHPRIRQIANQIFSGCTTTAQKMAAVTNYFHTNYTYSLGLEVPPGQDALTYFLVEASTGYCEYFASGAAVLLRLAAVPTRYVTGFLVTERGNDNRSWIARNMDAHAWVEAWDKEQGQWVIVEATTQEGLDDGSLADELVRGAGSGRPLLAQLVQSLYEYGLFGVIGRLFASYSLTTGAVLSLACFAAAFWVALRRRRRPRSSVSHPLSAEVLALHRLLGVMDRKARAWGYQRNPDETLHTFADRISQSSSQLTVPGSQSKTDGCQRTADNCQLSTVNRIAAWYLQYAGLRFCRVLDSVRLEHLQQLAQKLQQER